MTPPSSPHLTDTTASDAEPAAHPSADEHADDDAPPPWRLPLVRKLGLADVATLTRAGLGLLVCFLCVDFFRDGSPSSLWTGVGAVWAAALYDGVDGFLARADRESLYGFQLEPLARLLPFAVAPAMLGYSIGLDRALDTISLFVFAGCAVTRVVRFPTRAPTSAAEHRPWDAVPAGVGVVLAGLVAGALSSRTLADAIWFGEVELAGIGWHPLSAAYLLAGGVLTTVAWRLRR